MAEQCINWIQKLLEELWPKDECKKLKQMCEAEEHTWVGEVNGWIILCLGKGLENEASHKAEMK